MKIKDKINKIPYWVRFVISCLFIFIGSFAWGFATSDFFFAELSKHTSMVGDIEINLGVAWFYAHLGVIWCMIIALFCIFGGFLLKWTHDGKKKMGDIK